jgi:hypothetical protein
MAFGYCKLTRRQGTFVASHLIPKALTRPSEPGRFFIEAGKGNRPNIRWDSWFDKSLVIRSGEDILSSIDSNGIAELRKHQLLWSGRDFGAHVPDVTWVNEEFGFGFRVVKNVDGKKLRLFLLSILWRAAATNRREFEEINVSSRDLEQLRQMVLNGSVEPRAFYPAVLTQLTEIGEAHNFAPSAEEQERPALDDLPAGKIPTFRFYFNGLIVHFTKPSVDLKSLLHLDGLHVGGDELMVCTQRTDKSYQVSNMQKLVKEAHEEWPDVMNKIR